MTIFFTSDEHHGHARILELERRPFANAAEMTEGLIERHNAIVGPEDEVWHLGDFAWKFVLVKPILARLNGRHHLVPGNHDKCHPCHKRFPHELERYLAAGFESVALPNPGDDITLYTDGKIGQWRGPTTAPPLALLSHLPYVDEEDDRYAEWRPRRHGLPLLHGHVHSRWQWKHSGEQAQGERAKSLMINVGVDAWSFRPVSLDHILEILG